MPNGTRRQRHLIEAVEHNIAMLAAIRHQSRRQRSMHECIADYITAFSGSMFFIYFHVTWFLLWVLANTGYLGMEPFDPYPFGLLTMIVSLEAIFLATFILISQNRMEELQDRRAELDLQINLLAEHEITKILKIVDAIADHLKIPEGKDPELADLERDITPDKVLEAIARRQRP